MLVKIMLVAIFMAGDGSGYSDVVSVFDTKAKCEEARAVMLKSVRADAPKDALVFSACVKPVALHSLKV